VIHRSAQIHGELRQANFRSGSPHQLGSFLSPLATLVPPPTGLSLLMNGDVHNKNSSSISLSTSTSAPNIANLSTLSPSQQQRYQEDLLERENQASSLAAAGMVAESVSLTSPPQSLSKSLPVQGLQPPPTILAQTVPAPTTTSELDSINWNFMDIGAVHLDDMDMDFATLFDPANELSNMQTKGSGWPSSSAPIDTSTVSPTPILSQPGIDGLQPEKQPSSDHSLS
jgi:hypothetical protein